MSLSDAEAAALIEKKMERMRERVMQNGVFAYLNPKSRKDINKVFLAQTIRSVDSHNRRHEESKCWKQRELDEKVEKRDEYMRSHRQSSRKSRQRSRSVSREYENRSRGKRRDRSGSKATNMSSVNDSSPLSSSNGNPEDERRIWAEKKSRKTKELWEGLASGTVSIENAPNFDSGMSVDDEDERNKRKIRKKRKKGKNKSEKKNKKKKKKKEKHSSCSENDSTDSNSKLKCSHLH